MSKVFLDLKSIVRNVDNQLNIILGEDLPLLTKIKKHTIQSGGKRIRPILTYLLANLWYSGNVSKEKKEELYALAAIPEIIHAASLLHDDVLDEAKERRNAPSGRMLFGNKEVILAGDYLLACGIDRLNQFNNPSLMQVYTRVLKDLSVSELLQMQHRNHKIDLEMYFKIIYGKTASLFQACCESAAIYNEQSPNEIIAAGEIGKEMGFIFQIRDDWLDYFDSKKLKKEPYQDFINGLITYPILILKNKIKKSEYENLISTIRDTDKKNKLKIAPEFTAKLKKMGAHEIALEEMNIRNEQVKDFFFKTKDQTESKLILQQFTRLVAL